MEIISRTDAISAGLKYFFNNKPCRHGHISQRYVSSKGCVECVSDYYSKNKDEVIARSQDAYAKDKKSWQEKTKAWAKKNPDQWRFHQAKSWRKKYAEDDVFNVSCRIRSCLRRVVLQKTKSSKLLGCSWVDLANHLERQFVDGMGWHNRNEWHIDHIIPLATAKTEADVIALNHFTNLRPMWARENMSKGAKVLNLI